MKRQTFRSRYGRPTITVTATCPTRTITRKLGRVHVATSADQVEALIREAVAEALAQGVEGWTKSAENTAVRFALWQHAENRAAYAHVMGGTGWLKEMVAEHGHGGL